MSRFKDYATSTAFSISLSGAMCDAMEYLVLRRINSGIAGFHVCTKFPVMASVQSLERRGLAEHTVTGWKLTEAGTQLYPLLVMAGQVRSEDELSTLAAQGAA